MMNLHGITLRKATDAFSSCTKRTGEGQPKRCLTQRWPAAAVSPAAQVGMASYWPRPPHVGHFPDLELTEHQTYRSLSTVPTVGDAIRDVAEDKAVHSYNLTWR